MGAEGRSHADESKHERGLSVSGRQKPELSAGHRHGLQHALSFWNLQFVLDRISHNLGWPRALPSQGDLELVILPPAYFNIWDHRTAYHIVLFCIF